MKKVAAVICLAVVLLNCKKEDRGNTAPETPQTTRTADDESVDCDHHPTYLEIKDLDAEEFLAWVKIPANSQKICDEKLYQCIEESHVIPVGTFNSERRPGPNGQDFYPVKWSEIEAAANPEITCYEKYLHFDIIANKVSISIVDFTSSKSCYSLPFLRGVKELTGLGDPVFQIALTQSPGKIVFQVRNTAGNTLYYNISDNPKMLLQFE